ncbi:TRM9B-like protein, partial [Mya arenaria]
IWLLLDNKLSFVISFGIEANHRIDYVLLLTGLEKTERLLMNTMAAVKSCSHGRQGAKFESLHVQNIYNEIAPCMNNLENKAWPHVKRFLKRFPPGAVIADIGCGNGRYMDINKATFKVGIDVCCPLVDFAREKGHETLYGDNLHVPFRDGVFDGVVSIGVIHHFCSKARRVAALRELARILRPGGKLMLYVWAFEQKHRRFDGQDILIPWHEGCHREKRFGSTSSTHSSLGGLSSVSSLSEDEPSDSPRPVNQPEQSDLGGATTSSPRARASTNKILRRQGSVSLDDLMTVRELSDFKPNYYSLDFTKSPKRGIRKSNTDSYVWSNDLTNRQAQSRKDTLIQECRKLEASIRALSSGSLDLMQKTDDDLKIELRCGNSSHSLEHFDPSGTCEVKLKEMQVDDDAFEDKEDSSEYLVKTLADDLKINLDWNIGEIDDDFEDEILSNPVIIDSGYSENVQEDCDKNDKPELTRAGSKPEFSEEQIKLAQQLNFQVREFPLSSCPDVVTPDKEDMK